jgi:hypothetical protein
MNCGGWHKQNIYKKHAQNYRLNNQFIYGSTALVDFGRFSSFLIYTQSVENLGRGISQSQGRYLYTE